MIGHPYDGGALRLRGAVGSEYIDWLNDSIYIALLEGYTQDVENDAHWSDVKTYEITSGGYLPGGQELTTIDPYIEDTFTPFRYVVYNATTGNPPAYIISWTGITFTEISGAVLYKKGTTDENSPILTFISELSVKSSTGDRYIIEFGAPGVGLGLYHRQL